MDFLLEKNEMISAPIFNVWKMSIIPAITVMKLTEISSRSQQEQSQENHLRDKFYYEILAAAHRGAKWIRFPLKKDFDVDVSMILDQVKAMFPGIKGYYEGRDMHSYAFEWSMAVACLPSADTVMWAYERQQQLALKNATCGNCGIAAAAASDAAAAGRNAQEEKHQNELRKLQLEIHQLKVSATQTRWEYFAAGAKAAAEPREAEIKELKDVMLNLEEAMKKLEDIVSSHRYT